MAIKRKRVPRYRTVEVNGLTYYRTTIMDAEDNRLSLYGKTREELYDKEMAALEKIDNATFRRKSPTVAEYCEKWLFMKSENFSAATLKSYTYTMNTYIVKPLGQLRAINAESPCATRDDLSHIELLQEILTRNLLFFFA